MHESEKGKSSCLVVSYSLQPHGLQPTRLLCPWDFPGKSTGVGCHCLLCRDAANVSEFLFYDSLPVRAGATSESLSSTRVLITLLWMDPLQTTFTLGPLLLCFRVSSSPVSQPSTTFSGRAGGRGHLMINQVEKLSSSKIECNV